MSKRLKGGVSFEPSTEEPEVYNDITAPQGVLVEESPDEQLQLKDQIRELENLKNQVSAAKPQLKTEGTPSFSVPTEKVFLPSQGKAYPIGSPLYNAKEIEIRQMTASDEDVLTSRSLIRSGKVVDVLLSNCLVTPNVNVNDLLPGDRDAIMISLRANSYGSDYIIDISCPDCGEITEKHEFDLKKLDMKLLEIAPDDQCLFTYTLPSGTVIKFRLLTSGDETIVEETIEKIKKASRSEIDRSVTTRLKYQIVYVNDETGNELIGMFVDHLNVRDSRALRKHLADMEPDIVREQEFSCRHCGTKSDIDMPITAEFFFPSA